MNRENDSKILEWTGITQLDSCHGGYSAKIKGSWMPVPAYTTSDSAAITLLPMLVERGYEVRLKSVMDGWDFIIFDFARDKDFSGVKETIPSAICAAVLELIERGAE